MNLSEIYHPYTMSADFFLNEAEKSDNLRYNHLKLLAAGRFLLDQQPEEAILILQSIQALTNDQATILQVLWGQYYWLTGYPLKTIEVLAKAKMVHQSDIYYQCQYHELLAKAYEANHQYSEACLQRIKLDILLAENKTQSINRQKIWQMLQKIPQADLDSLYLEETPGSDWRGWLDLTRIIKDNQANQTIQNWEKNYPLHPALAISQQYAKVINDKKNTLFSLFNFSNSVEIKKIRQIALLLPLSGELKAPGEAIKSGFMAAYHQKKSHIKIRCYDTHDGGALKQYHQAIADGASIIVGPLTKNDVQSVGSRFSTTPTLLLNDYSGSLSRYQFAVGYSPKDEAIQLANIMQQKAYKRIMVIVPSNHWGQEIAKAYQSAAAKNQMNIIASIYYSQNTNMSQAIRNAMRYSENKTRDEKGHLKVYGSRRQDIDAIFLVAYPSVARQVVPLLKYYYAGDIPTYSLSAAYDAFYNPSQNKDLDGLYFIDIPWVFNHQLGHRPWPENWNTYSRLYALGWDSFTLTQDWSRLQSHPESGLLKETGLLHVMPNGHIRRTLRLGQIRQGLARENGLN